MTRHGIDLESAALQSFCRRWKIRELRVFGSILRDDFRPESDIDLLVEFESEEARLEFDAIEAESELVHELHHKVDLVPKERLKWVVRDRVLDSSQVIYAA